MLFKQVILQGIADGRVTLAFRRWQRATVKTDGSLKTAVGLLHIQSVEKINSSQITPLAVKQAGFDSLDALLESLGDRDGELYRIAFRLVGEDPRIALREDDNLNTDDLAELQTRLERLDHYSQLGPWTQQVLELIAAYPEQRAAELARRSQFEKEWLKLNIRKLKNLGLTESLKEGYRLSPRGEAYLKGSKE